MDCKIEKNVFVVLSSHLNALVLSNIKRKLIFERTSQNISKETCYVHLLYARMTLSPDPFGEFVQMM